MSSMPVILVSAKTKDAALNFITELIDSEPPTEESKEAKANESSGRTWRIQNKYYTADVRLLPAPDSESPPHEAPEGHIIYLADDEVTVEAANRREGVGVDAEVRVLAAECAELPESLAAWAARACLEPVPLKEPPDDDEDELGNLEPRGIAAARAALHAHAWPGMTRAGAPRDSGSEEDVERAEQWAAALGALGGAARAVRELSGNERREAAEQLVAAFCRALGEDLDTL